jgi:hypothetical protein
MLILALAGAACVVVLLAKLRWDNLNSKDLGTMSTQWLAEYNSQNP